MTFLTDFLCEMRSTYNMKAYHITKFNTYHDWVRDLTIINCPVLLLVCTSDKFCPVQNQVGGRLFTAGFKSTWILDPTIYT